MTSSWTLLLLAIVAEVAATTALRASDGFTRLLPSVVVVAGYAVSFWLLARIVHAMPVGVVYAVWSGIGIVLVSILGAVIYGQRLDAWAVLGVGLILAGVVVIRLMSSSAAV